MLGQTQSPNTGSDVVWTFRGYQMRPGEFNTAMVHFYRAEVTRTNVWRQRLDTTTNWAVVATGAAISFSLSSPNNHYGVLILNTLLVTLFLWMEARRYRYYELWSHRVRLMETEFFANMLVPPFRPGTDWAENLAESLLQPEFPISMLEAFGRRLRRNYVWIFFILGAAWVLKTYLHPLPTQNFGEFIQRSAMGPIPGWAMVSAGLLYNGFLFFLAIITAGLRQAEGEVLSHWGDDDDVPVLGNMMDSFRVNKTNKQGSENPQTTARQTRRPWIQHRQRKQFMALIISAKPQPIADRILSQMQRGVTGLEGVGMFTNRTSRVLLCAVTVTEMPQLKAIVRAEDENAFMIVAPAQEIFGRGFQTSA